MDLDRTKKKRGCGTMAGTYKIMIADDFPILREDLAEMIGEQPDTKK